MGLPEKWHYLKFIVELIRRRFSFSCVLFLLFFVSPNALGQTQAESSAANSSPPILTIPNGTPVQLRFAQPLWGRTAGYFSRPRDAQPGDVIRLVAAADVVVGRQVAIRKGSPAQATVKNVWVPPRDSKGVQDICVCISLNLDWVKSIDDQDIPLRSNTKGKAGPFELQVHSTKTGAIAKPLSWRADLIRDFETGFLLNLRELIHRKDWVPAGTRMTAFVDGDAALDASEVHEMEPGLPIPNETGLVMIYRTKGEKDIHPVIYCDSKAVGPVGSKQFIALEMDPGEHKCRANQDGPLDFSVTGGQEYYLRLQLGTFADHWKLSLVDNLEGEDGVAAASPASNAQTDNEPH